MASGDSTMLRRAQKGAGNKYDIVRQSTWHLKVKVASVDVTGCSIKIFHERHIERLIHTSTLLTANLSIWCKDFPFVCSNVSLKRKRDCVELTRETYDTCTSYVITDRRRGAVMCFILLYLCGEGIAVREGCLEAAGLPDPQQPETISGSTASASVPPLLTDSSRAIDIPSVRHTHRISHVTSSIDFFVHGMNMRISPIHISTTPSQRDQAISTSWDI